MECDVCSTQGIPDRYSEPPQKPVAGEVTGLSEDATAAVLLNGLDVPVEMPSKQLCL